MPAYAWPPVVTAEPIHSPKSIWISGRFQLFFLEFVTMFHSSFCEATTKMVSSFNVPVFMCGFRCSGFSVRVSVFGFRDKPFRKTEARNPSHTIAWFGFQGDFKIRRRRLPVAAEMALPTSFIVQSGDVVRGSFFRSRWERR